MKPPRIDPNSSTRKRGTMRSLRASVVLSITLSLLLTPVSTSVPVASAQLEQEVPYLVWPMPPDKPRIRYLGQLRHNYDVEPLKRQGILDRLIGAPDPNVVYAMKKPAGVTTDSKGRLLVADSGASVIFVFDEANDEVTYLGLDQSKGIRPATPVDVLADSRDRVFVADVGLKSVLVFAPEGHLLSIVTDPDRLRNPAGLAIDEDRGRLYVVDSHGHRVVVFDAETFAWIGEFGEEGEGDGKFLYPVGIAIAPDGRVYVTDTGSCTVQVFSPEYEFLDSFGGRGVAPSQFTRPKQIAFDSEGHVYVLDAAFDNFQIFSPDHRLLMFVGGSGSDPGMFNIPWGIHIDDQDRLYVSDQLNGRVQKFQFLGGQ